MFFDEITQVTADHLLDHLVEYTARFGIPAPRKIELDGLIGGVMTQETLPVYAIDCSTKALSETSENLITYIYVGQITGLVGGSSPQESNHLVRRHEALCETFVKEHAFLANPDTTDFKMLEMAFTDVEFTGSANIEANSEAAPYWVAAFRIELNWLVSENAQRQHDA